MLSKGVQSSVCCSRQGVREGERPVSSSNSSSNNSSSSSSSSLVPVEAEAGGWVPLGNWRGEGQREGGKAEQGAVPTEVRRAIDQLRLCRMPCCVLCAQAVRPSTALPSGTSSTAVCASHTEGWSRVPMQMRSTPMAPSSSSLWTSERGAGVGGYYMRVCAGPGVCICLVAKQRWIGWHWTSGWVLRENTGRVQVRVCVLGEGLFWLYDAGEVLGKAHLDCCVGVTSVAAAAAVPVMRPKRGCRVSHAHFPSTCAWLALHALAPPPPRQV